jgi:hypothetical protein
MEFYVKLIEAAEDLSDDEKQELEDNCTFVKNNIWIYEGEEYALDTRFSVLSDGIIGSLGGLSQDELIDICKSTFVFNASTTLAKLFRKGWLKRTEAKDSTGGIYYQYYVDF